MKRTVSHRMRQGSALLALATAALLVPALGAGVADAKGGGGTATPPPGAVAPFVEPTLSQPVAGFQPFTTDVANIHGFDVTGFLQDATVATTNAACPNTPAPTPTSNRLGGTVKLNNVTITVPCNVTIQMPANTFTWADFVNSGPNTTLNGAPPPAPSFELRVVGNIVAGKHVAALMFFSQQSINTGQGYITAIDYPTGSFTVDTGVGNQPARIQLNDPKITGLKDAAGNDTGRQSKGQSPDPRLSMDQSNPTVVSKTGYPLCVPRVAPGADPAVETDPLCPQKNRPLAVGGCRNFSQAGVVPPISGELSPPAPGQKFCSQFVLKNPNLTGAPSFQVRAATDPDARQQVPFEVGDSVLFSGSLFTDAAGPFISAHTVEASLGLYTQPGSTPSYIHIGVATIGTADPLAVAVNGAAQETKDRLVLEAETTDVQSPADIYLTDISPTTGKVRNRWATPQAMTGENNGPNQAGTVIPIGGGITTQFTGPQPQRIRLRANKAPAGLLSNPSRTVRVTNRATCVPNAPSGNNPDPNAATPVDLCLNNLPTNANGLQAGEYTAPIFNFIFPENIRAGDVIVPNDFWHLGFLRFGEGANAITPAVGPLEPTPW